MLKVAVYELKSTYSTQSCQVDNAVKISAKNVKYCSHFKSNHAKYNGVYSYSLCI